MYWSLLANIGAQKPCLFNNLSRRIVTNSDQYPIEHRLLAAVPSSAALAIARALLGVLLGARMYRHVRRSLGARRPTTPTVVPSPGLLDCTLRSRSRRREATSQGSPGTVACMVRAIVP